MSDKEALPHIFYRWFWRVFASVIIISAVAISFLRFALSEIEGYHAHIEKLASDISGYKIVIGSLDARLVGLTPTLILNNIEARDEKKQQNILSLSQAGVGFSVTQSIRFKQLIPKDISISGTNLAIVRKANGNLMLQGFELPPKLAVDDAASQTKINEPLTEWFLTQASLSIKDSTLVWQDETKKTPGVILKDINLNIDNSGNQHLVTARFSPSSNIGKSFELVFDVQGDLRQPASWKGDFFVQGDEFDISSLRQFLIKSDITVTQGIADFQLWGKVIDGSLAKLWTDFSAYQVSFGKVKRKPIEINLVGGLFSFANDSDGWQLNVERFQFASKEGSLPETRLSLLASKNETGEYGYDIRVSDLNLKIISQIVLKSGLLQDKHQTILQTVNPSGNVKNLVLNYQPTGDDSAPEFKAHTFLQNISSSPYKKIPGIQNISGSLWLNNNKGQLQVDSQASGFEFAKLFRKPIKMDKLRGTVNWWRSTKGWQVEVAELDTVSNEITSTHHIKLDIPASGKPYMDLQSTFKADIRYKSNYLPTGIMKDKLVKWIEHSLVSGEIVQGHAIFRGRFSDFPFREPNGQFLVKVKARDFKLDYKEGWPALDNIVMGASFDSQSVSLALESGKLFNSNITNTTAVIPDFRTATLDLTGTVKGSFHDVGRFLIESPIVRSTDVLKAVDYKGTATTSLNLTIPLSKKSKAKTSYKGDVVLKNAAMFMLGKKVDITDINGKLNFSDRLSARSRRHHAVAAAVLSESGAGRRLRHFRLRRHQSRLRQHARFPPLHARVPGYKHLAGSSDWHGLLQVGLNANSGVPSLLITSDLVGTEITIPAPFAKSAEEVRNLTLSVSFKDKKHTEIFSQYGNLVSLLFSLENKQKNTEVKKAMFHFGSVVNKPKLPQQEQWLVSGNLTGFYYQDWADFINTYIKDKEGEDTPLPIQVNMTKLQVIEREDDKKTEARSVKPGSVPLINATVSDFQVNDMKLGALSLQTSRISGDMRINKLQLKSNKADLEMHGIWQHARGHNSTRFKVNFNSPDLGTLLTDLGYSAIIDDGVARVTGDIAWDAAPHQFSLDKLTGKLNALIKKGVIVEVDPGAGRVVGLLSLSELPRRLMLDFSDAFKEGFVFDEIKGSMNLSGGSIYSRDMKLSSTAADVQLEGRTGLVDKDYDQTVKVFPKVGKTLPVASGVLFGTQVGYIVWAFERLFGKDIQKATGRTYRITGTWDKPVIKRMDGETPQKDQVAPG